VFKDGGLTVDTRKLKEGADENRVVERTILTFWKHIENYKRDDIEDYDRVFKGVDTNNLKLRVRELSLTIFTWDSLDSEVEHVVVVLTVKYNNKVIGTYRVLFNLNGEEEDDYLDIDVK
jgi:hypothetical protein